VNYTLRLELLGSPERYCSIKLVFSLFIPAYRVKCLDAGLWHNIQKEQLIDCMKVHEQFVHAFKAFQYIWYLNFNIVINIYYNVLGNPGEFCAGTTSGLHPPRRPAFGKIIRHSETEGMNCTCLPQCTDRSYSISTEIAVLEPKFAQFRSVLWVFQNITKYPHFMNIQFYTSFCKHA
jgi:hypothetical protein